MKKAILIPDSFKGSLSSLEICEIMQKSIRAHHPDCETVSIPVADGGEGSVDCFLSAMDGCRVELEVYGPFMEKMTGFYGLVDNGATAVIEMASCAGLPLVENRKDPRKTTTYGVGETMLAAAKSGAKKLVIGLGGSATNDGACGAAAACGVKFFDKNGNSFVPTGGTLIDVAHIDVSGLDTAFAGLEIVAMCDIDNPMYGTTGAAYIFGPQKGADEEMVKELDAGLRSLCEVMKKDLGLDLSQTPGGGAAGAMGAGMVAFFGARRQMGIQTVLDTVGFDTLAAGADLVFTGEGKLDTQSLRGKVVIGGAQRAKKLGVPVVAVVGGADTGIDEAYDMGVSAVFTINRLPQDLSVSRSHSHENLAFAMDNILRLEKLKG
jgi:glycerate kinase